MRPGRKPRIRSDLIFEVLREFPIFQENGTLKPRKDPVWVEALNRLDNQITLHNLYIFVHQDRHDILQKLLKHNNLNVPLKPKRAKKKPPAPIYDTKWDEYEYYDELDGESPYEGLNVMDSIVSMRNQAKFYNVLRKISVVPFIVTYWHPDQVTLWNEYSKHESVVSLIVLDSVVSKITGGLYETENILLFALSARVETSTILFTQMISDSSDPLDLEFFLTSWLQDGAPPPAQITVGYSYNLLDAVSLAFNFCSFDQYNLRCFKYLSNELEELPSTLLQIDIVTLIKVINQWPCYENLLQSVKDFYLCSIMYLSTVQDINVFRETTVTVLILCQSPYLNEAAESRKGTLWDHLTSDTIQKMNQQYIDFMTGKSVSKSFSYYDPVRNQIVVNPTHELHDYINACKLEAFNLCDFNTEVERPANDFYCPIILENLIQLLSEFPSWTQIIPKKVECSMLVSTNVTKHLAAFSGLTKLVTPAKYLEYHIGKVTAMNQLMKNIMSRNKKYKNDGPNKNTLDSVSVSAKQSILDHQYDSRIEITIPNEEIIVEEVNTPTNVIGIANEGIAVITKDIEPIATDVTLVKTPNKKAKTDAISDLDLQNLKTTVKSTLHLLSDFDVFVRDTVEQVLPGQETSICRTLLDCCTEMKKYEKFFGMLVEKFCYESDAIACSFAKMFGDIYVTLEVLEKNELKNITRLFAYLLSSDSISWEILSALKVNEKAMTNAKKSFLKILLNDMSEIMSPQKLEERFLNVGHNSSYEGLFPFINEKDSRFAQNFYKSIGLRNLADLFRDDYRQEKYALMSGDLRPPVLKRKKNEPVLKRVGSDSSISSNSSCEFLVELKVSKNHGKKIETKKVFKIK
ncbi:hypothetical protein QAD02_009408 [Eretmocerus hayati]|uniref:Uncharacterized protein n=1 Tax=Eretmocerus hayati TaxID=131215 RepID=A0ACC2N982_9HYME|nr:hypothetical protein QAD02_009408 [Eretmocerus hayati]